MTPEQATAARQTLADVLQALTTLGQLLTAAEGGQSETTEIIAAALHQGQLAVDLAVQCAADAA